MRLADDIITKVRRSFNEDDSLRTLQMLKELAAEDATIFNDRILRCLVVLSGNSLDGLVKAAAIARVDWRDVISMAEYECGDRVRLLALPFGVHPDLELFKQWFIGQEISIPWAGDQKWLVKSSDIRSLSLEEVRPLKEDNEKVLSSDLYFAGLSFLLIRGDKEISASHAIEGKAFFYYQLMPAANAFEFKKFGCDPKKLGKRGKW